MICVSLACPSVHLPRGIWQNVQQAFRCDDLEKLNLVERGSGPDATFASPKALLICVNIHFVAIFHQLPIILEKASQQCRTIVMLAIVKKHPHVTCVDGVAIAPGLVHSGDEHLGA